MRTRTLLLFLVYSMPKVETSSPKQMPLIPQTKWIYHVYLCVFFWFSELKQTGSATTNAKGPHQLLCFLFVFVRHLFCISTWVCLCVCLLFLLLCSCEYYWHTRYKTCHKPWPGLYGPRVSCVHVRLATVTNPCPLWPPLWPLLACEWICCIFLVESWVCLWVRWCGYLCVMWPEIAIPNSEYNIRN